MVSRSIGKVSIFQSEVGDASAKLTFSTLSEGHHVRLFVNRQEQPVLTSFGEKGVHAQASFVLPDESFVEINICTSSGLHAGHGSAVYHAQERMYHHRELGTLSLSIEINRNIQSTEDFRGA